LDNHYTQFSGNNPFGSQAKMCFHSDRLFDYLNKGDCKPVFAEVNLSSVCNLKCKWCISSNFTQKDVLNKRVFVGFVKGFTDMGGKAITFSGGGEPTLHLDFDSFVVITRNYGIELGLMTNGVFADKTDVIGRNCKWVRFSLDTLDKMKYKKNKGIDAVDIVCNNIRELQPFPIKRGINVNIGEDYTIQEAKDIISFASEYAEYIQFRPILPRYFTNEKVLLNKGVWDFLLSLDSSSINLSNDKLSDIQGGGCLFPYRSCEGHFFSFVLNSNGDILPCMYHPNDDRFVFGNLNNASFEEIWKSKQRKSVIDFLRFEIDMEKECQMCCKNHELNKFIQFFKYPTEGLDINFL